MLISRADGTASFFGYKRILMSSITKLKRVGIFAGAFDPIHDGHLEVARKTVKYLELDLLVFMVEAEPWGQKLPADLRHRNEMARLAIAKDKNMSLLEISDNRFTIEQTLPKIEQQFIGAELYFIFGADVFIKMDQKQWPHLEKLLRHYLVIFERGDITEEQITKHSQELNIPIAVLPSPHPHHTSSNVRENIHKSSLWVPANVAEYIQTNSLYLD